MNRIFFIIFLSVLPNVFVWSKAVCHEQKKESSCHSVSLSGGLTFDDTWKVELSYRFTPFRYTGIGIGIGYWSQYGNEDIPHETMIWTVNKDTKDIGDFYLRPNIMFYTPSLFHIRDCYFAIFANPGAILNIPYGNANIDLIDNTGVVTGSDNVHNSHGKWSAFDLRFGLRFGTEDTHFFIGYELSTMDVYGMYRRMEYRNVKFNDFYPHCKNQKGLIFDISVGL